MVIRGTNRKVKAVTLEGKGSLKIKEYPYPDLKENCAIIKMEYSGICGTDKHSFEGYFYQKGGRPIPLPIAPKELNKAIPIARPQNHHLDGSSLVARLIAVDGCNLSQHWLGA